MWCQGSCWQGFCERCCHLADFTGFKLRSDEHNAMLSSLCCVFIRIGRRRATPLAEILSTGTDRRDVRRAETAWRRSTRTARRRSARPPPACAPAPCATAIARREPPEVVRRARRGLLAVGRRRRPAGAAAAGAAVSPRRRCARRRRRGGPHGGRGIAAPRGAPRGAADRRARPPTGLDPAEATRAASLLLDHRDLLTDDVLVITGRGKHSQTGLSSSSARSTSC